MYGILFFLMVFIFLCAVMVELRSFCRMALMLAALPAHDENGPGQANGLQMVKDPDSNEKTWRMSHMSEGVKALAWFLCAFELVITCAIAYVGVVLLIDTTTKLDLILNGLALTFLLDLDKVLYAAMIPQKQQQMIDDLMPIKYQSLLPRVYLRNHRALFPFVAFVVCYGLTLIARAVQINEFELLFNASASVCLFAGPPPPGHEEEYYAPVPGFCESLTGATCQDSTSVFGSGKGQCVITDFDAHWAKNVASVSTESVWVGDAMKEVGSSLWDWTWDTSHANWPNRKYDLTNKAYAFFTEDSSTILRKACFAMYDPQGASTHDVVVDGGTDEKAIAAPFYCNMQKSGLKSSTFNELSYTGSGTRARLVFEFKLHEQIPWVGRALANCH